MKLTKNFSLEELNPHGHELTPELLANLTRLAKALQDVRDWVKAPMIITSGYRTFAEQKALYEGNHYNKAVAKPGHSQHELGLAADIARDCFTIHDTCELYDHWKGGMGVYGTFIHLDLRPPNKDGSYARW